MLCKQAELRHHVEKPYGTDCEPIKLKLDTLSLVLRTVSPTEPQHVIFKFSTRGLAPRFSIVYGLYKQHHLFNS